MKTGNKVHGAGRRVLKRTHGGITLVRNQRNQRHFTGAEPISPRSFDYRPEQHRPFAQDDRDGGMISAAFQVLASNEHLVIRRNIQCARSVRDIKLYDHTCMEHLYFVYMMTNGLKTRVWQHKTGKIKGFTSRYNLTKLVWYEDYEWIQDAIAREKQIKRWSRKKKIALIEKMNPEWNDLYDLL